MFLCRNTQYTKSSKVHCRNGIIWPENSELWSLSEKCHKSSVSMGKSPNQVKWGACRHRVAPALLSSHLNWSSALPAPKPPLGHQGDPRPGAGMGSPSTPCNIPAAGSFLLLGWAEVEEGAVQLLWESVTHKLRAFDLWSARGKDVLTKSLSYSINFQAQLTLQEQTGKGLLQMSLSHTRAQGCSWLGWEHESKLGPAMVQESLGADGEEGLKRTME